MLTLLAVVDVWILDLIHDSPEGLQWTSVLRTLRLSRLVRLLKLMTIFHELFIVLLALWHMLQTMLFFMMILLFFFLVCSLFMVDAIGRNKALEDVRIMGSDTVRDRFGTVMQSMYSLFELMTLEGWTDVYRPIVNSEPWFALFFSFFIMMFSYGALNVVIALVIERALKCRNTLINMTLEESLRHGRAELDAIRILICGQDAGLRKPAMCCMDFQAAIDTNVAFRCLFNNLDSSLVDVEELFTIFDLDNSGQLSVDELCDGLAKVGDERICADELLGHVLAVRSAAQGSNKQLTDLHSAFAELWAATEQWNMNAVA